MLVRKNGQLVEVSPEEAQRLQAASVSAPTTPPGTPSGVAAADGTTDQAKMAGTPNQQKGAVEASVKATETLSGTKRLDQGRQQATEAESSAAARAQKFGTLGSLGGRVEAMAAQQVAGLSKVGGASVDKAALEALPGYATLDQKKKDLLGLQLLQLGQTTDPKMREDLIVQMRSSGTVPTDFDPTKLLVGKEQLAGGAATGMIDPGQVTMGTLDPKTLGMSEQDMAGLLGPDWKNMTMAQVTAAVNQEQHQKYSQTSALQAEMADPMTSPARKAQLAQQLQALGQAGVATTEQAVQQTAASVAGLDEKTQALLSDENVTQSVQEYLADPTGSDLKTKFPALAAWVDQNASTLNGLMEGIGTANTAVKKRAEESTKAYTEAAGDKDISALNGILGTGEAIPSTLLDLSKSSGKPEMLTWANDIAAYDPKMAKELLKMNPEDLKKAAESGALEKYAGVYRQLNELHKLPADTDKLMEFVYGQTGMTADEATASYESDQELAKDGDPAAQARVSKFRNLFDQSPQDGYVDEPGDIRSRIQSSLGKLEGNTITDLTNAVKGQGGFGGDKGDRSLSGPVEFGLNAAAGGATKLLYSALKAGEMTDNPAKFLYKIDQAASLDPNASAGDLPEGWDADKVTKITATVDTLKTQLAGVEDPNQKKELQAQITRINKGLDAMNKWHDTATASADRLKEEVSNLARHERMFSGQAFKHSPEYNELKRKENILATLQAGIDQYEAPKDA